MWVFMSRFWGEKVTPAARLKTQGTQGAKHTNTSATSIIQQPHALCLGSLLLLPSLLVIVLVINHPVRPDEVDPGPDLLNQLVQRLLVLAVVARGLLAKLRDRVSS
jgi:hypothetical protein